MLERKWAEAAERWAIIREAYPEHADPVVQGATAQIEADNLSEADALLEYARANFPNHPGTLITSAKLAIRREEFCEAQLLLQQACEKFPDDINVWLNCADCFELQGRLEEAASCNKHARQRFPDRPGPLIQYAEQSMRSARYEEALERWSLVRSRFPAVAAGYLRAAEAARHLKLPKVARELTLIYQYGEDIVSEGTLPERICPKHRGIIERLTRFLELVWTKALFNLQSEVDRSYLSYGWWILEPLVHMAAYYLVFGVLLQRGGENYPAFLLSGLIPWIWFSKAINACSNSIIGGQHLLTQTGLSAVAFPLISLLQTSLKQLPVFGLLLAFLWFQGFTPGSHLWALFPVMLVQILIMTAVGCAVAAIIPFFRDLSYLVPTGLMFLMFASGIFYDYRVIPEEWQQLFLLNPVAFLLKSFRAVVLEGVVPDLYVLASWGLGSAAATLSILLLYQKLRYIYPRIVGQ
jgi:lipopolysaccharide transport system permease protein